MRIPVALAASALIAALAAGPAHAATSTGCADGSFTVIAPSGKKITQRGDQLKPADLRGRVQVRGTYVGFDVDPANLAVYDYTMTGAASPLDITGGVRTPVFASKVPQLPGPLTDDLRVDARDGTLALVRQGRSGEKKVTMKIQAKDCAQGGIFQMEPEIEPAQNVTVTHTLAPGMFFFKNPYANGKINFGNGTMFRGKDSPQVATLMLQTEAQSVWSVASGGRLGGVLGEDAVEIGAGATPCVEDCQAQNQIHGALPVYDPAYAETSAG